MPARDHRQGMAPALVSEPQARSPERQALAACIQERRRVAGLIETAQARAAEIHEHGMNLHAERRRLLAARNEDLPVPAARLNALLAGADLDEAEADREDLDRRIAAVEAELEKAKGARDRAEADVALLETDHARLERDISQRVAEVMQVDPALPAMVAEMESLLQRKAVLGRALAGAFNVQRPGEPTPRHARMNNLIVAPAGPCPWAAARERLRDDPDAALPMPGDV